MQHISPGIGYFIYSGHYWSLKIHYLHIQEGAYQVVGIRFKLEHAKPLTGLMTVALQDKPPDFIHILVPSGNRLVNVG